MADTNTLEKCETTVTETQRCDTGHYVPAVDIIEAGDELILKADVPGARAEDIEIDFDKGQLTIHARLTDRQPGLKTGYLLHEYGIGDFHRSFKIGDGIAADKISAEVTDGVLTLHLPKAESARQRKIEVKAG